MSDWWELPTSYNNGSVVDGAGDLFVTYPAFITNNYLTIALTVIIWLVLFGLNLAFGSKKALTTASFVTFLLSLPLVVSGNMNPFVSVILIVLTIIGLLGSKEEGGY